MSRLFTPFVRERKIIPPSPSKLNLGHPLARGLQNLWVTLPGWNWKTCHVSGNQVTIGVSTFGTLDMRGLATDATVDTMVYFPLSMNLVAPFTLLMVHRNISGVSWSAMTQSNSNWDGYYVTASWASNNTFDGSASGTLAGSVSFDPHAATSTVFTIRGANDAAGCNWGGEVRNDTSFTMPLGTNINQLWLGAAERSGYDNLGAGFTKMVGVWNRAFADHELRSLSRNPWQLFSPQTDIMNSIYFPPGSAPTATARSYGYVMG